MRDLPLDHLEESRPHGHGRDQQRLVVALERVTRQEIEQVDGVSRQLGIRGEQAQIGIQVRGHHVVVAGG